MRDRRFIFLYFVLLPAIVVAAGVLGYYMYQTASQFERLGEESIAQSTLVLVEDKVDRIEQHIIRSDNQAFGVVDLDNLDQLAATWKAQAGRISPSIRALLVLDETPRVLAYAARASEGDAKRFKKVFLGRILPELELERLRDTRLKHLHKDFAGQSFLMSYRAIDYAGRRYYLVAHHDVGHLKRHLFPQVFATEQGKHLYNVLDEDNRQVYGPSLARAGDYVVGRRFPTTLYGWRLQLAPKAAPLLQAKGRSRRFNEVALIGLSLAVILLGVIFLAYAANKERRLNQLKSEFIANVSHELKTPLSVVRMFGDLLLSGRVHKAEKQQQYLEIICGESERLTNLIENVLDFAALEQGKRRYQKQPCDLFDVASRAIDTLRYRIEQENIEVALTREGDPASVRADEQAILLAIINLLDNALKYGGQGSIQVTVATQPKEVQVQVRDHGPGIAPEDLKRVFERFFRAGRERTTRGSGIGLSLVKHIAEDHGGRAWAEAAHEGGARVALAVPRLHPAKVSQPFAEPLAAPAGPGRAPDR